MWYVSVPTEVEAETPVPVHEYDVPGLIIREHDVFGKNVAIVRIPVD
jgi:hypothetical protein